MKSKKLLLLLVVTLMLCVMFVACDETTPDSPQEPTDHVHAFGEWKTTKDATCAETGLQERACSCGEKESKSIDKVAHTNGTPVVENEIDSTCKVEGSYDEVIYCSVCETEMSRTAKTIDKKTEHTPATPVVENEVDSTCKEEGSYDEVVYCSVCEIELSRTAKTIEKKKHVYDQSVATDAFLAKAATCTARAEYYISCKCGDRGTSTFPYDELANHIYSNAWEQNDTHHWHKATCVHTEEISGKAEHNFGNDLICDTCLFEKEEDKISFKTLQANGTTVYGKVSNDTEIFSFIQEVAVSGKATYTVYLDVSGTQPIATKTVTLQIGDNTFYVLETVGHDITLYTVTIRRRPMYTVTFDPTGGTYVAPQTVEEDATIAAPETTKTGYTFAGWNYDLSMPIINNTAITASWTANEYTITYDTNGGTLESNTQTATYDATYTLAVPERTGYTFVGWYNGEALFENGTWLLTEDVTLTAAWEIVTYDISYNLNGGTADNESTYTVEDTITLVAPTRTGYTFVGWTFDGQTEPLLDVTIAKGTIGDQSYTANWTANEYTITYILNGGDALENDTQTVTYDVAYTLVAPTRKGYTFAGWYNGRDKFENGVWNVAGNLVLTAAWDANDYQISYQLNGGKGENATTYTIEDTITLTAPTRAGYTFAGWTFEGQSEPTLNVTIEKGTIGNQSYTANWTPNTYTVTYKANGGILDISTVDVVYGSDFKPATPTRTGYTFNGWHYTNSNGIVEKYSSDYYTIAGNVTLEAAWNANHYTITYNVNGGTISSVTQRVTYDSTYTLLIPTKTGYDFLGWYDGSIKIGNGTWTRTQGMNLTANWKAKTYTITLNANGGSGTPASTTATYYSPYTLPTPTKSGYDFAGWYHGNTEYSSGTWTNDGDLTLTAKWEAVFTRNEGQITGLTTYGKNNLTSIAIPSSIDGVTITSIGSEAFRGFTELTNITIPDSVTSIGSYTFHNCYNLTNITMPNALTSIGSYAFYNCNSLTSIIIPNSVTSIGSGAFSECTELTSITLPFVGSSKTSASYTNFGYIFGTSSYSYHSNYVPSSLKTVVITGGTSIGSNAFRGCTGLTSITIPDSVTSIGNSAFYNCSNLKNITIPDSVASIGGSAFLGCSSLESITLPFVGSSKTSASYTNFGYIFGTSSYSSHSSHVPTSLKTVVITGGTSIGNNAFYNCTRMTSITIPDSVTSIGSSAFYNCTGLTNITIPNSVKSIGNSAFYNCSSLTSITIPDSVTSIGDSAFSSCSSLTIYCKAPVQPSGWNVDWNSSDRPVLWGYNAEKITYVFETNGGYAINNIVSSAAITLPTPQKEGMVFMGWYDNANLSGRALTSPYYSATKRTLYAKWKLEDESSYGSNFDKAIVMGVGNTYTANISTGGQMIYYAFTATESRSYKFFSSGNQDTYGYLYDSNQKQITYNDDLIDRNFSITRTLTEGETYYLVVKLRSRASTGSFTVSVT